jgi:hypothetical protein
MTFVNPALEHDDNALTPEDASRADHYAACARLLLAPPDEALHAALAQVEADPDTPLSAAWSALAASARALPPADIDDEFARAVRQHRQSGSSILTQWFLLPDRLHLNEKPLAEFLVGAGVTAGAARGRAPPAAERDRAGRGADPAPASEPAKTEIKHTVCSHCSVGCSVEAVVSNGVWVRQEAAFDSPINMGAHCAKGASVREHGFGEHRLRYPMKLVNGKYERISWDQAINEIGDKLLQLRQQSGPDSLMMDRQLQAQQRAVLPAAQVRPSMWGRTTATTRRASATRPPSPAWPRPSATAR